ncbi:hypothetical protein IAD21_01400 [Abditibacteriota bacterium]|nr:hypothetical protein IAD21_01400 [Abditibacteriota bacterium]
MGCNVHRYTSSKSVAEHSKLGSWVVLRSGSREMKSYWRSLVGVSLVSALAIAPLLVLGTAKGRLRAAPLSHYYTFTDATWGEIGTVYLGAAFVCFAFFMAVGAMILFLSLMMDRVPPPFPHERPNEKGED